MLSDGVWTPLEAIKKRAVVSGVGRIRGPKLLKQSFLPNNLTRHLEEQEEMQPLSKDMHM